MQSSAAPTVIQVRGPIWCWVWVLEPVQYHPGLQPTLAGDPQKPQKTIFRGPPFGAHLWRMEWLVWCVFLRVCWTTLLLPVWIQRCPQASTHFDKQMSNIGKEAAAFQFRQTHQKYACHFHVCMVIHDLLHELVFTIVYHLTFLCTHLGSI